MTDVSVVMPVRDGERFLAEAIRSVLAQSFRDFELVVVLDHSTDGSASIAHGLAANDPRVRVIDNPGEGLVDALNIGVAASAGALVARLDADDRMRGGRLERQHGVLLAAPDISLLGSAAIVIDEGGHEVGRIRVPTADEAIRARLPRGNPFVHSSVMFRRSAFAAVGGYRADFPLNEDYDLWLRLAGTGSLANLAEPLVDHRRHGEGVSARNAERQRLERRLCLLAWKRDNRLLDEAAHRRIRDRLAAVSGRLVDLTADPSAWRKDDLPLFASALPELGSADARSLVHLVRKAADRSAISGNAALRFWLDARIFSRLGYARAGRPAVRALRRRAAGPLR
jgi:glycosyltransferase involved in cell wall biosynthesis